MNSQQFILWLKGFTEGVHEYNVTPKQWTLLKEKLAEVKDEPTYSSPIETPNPFITPYKYDPYRVYCGDAGTGTPNPPYTLTTTPGLSSITIANPNIASFGDLSTSTSTSLPSGSTITFTNNGSPNWYATYFNDLKPDDNDR